MSDQAMQPLNDANERSRQTLQPFQSVWLAHWMRTSCDAAGETTSIPDASENEEFEYVTKTYDLTKGLEGSARSVEGLGMTKTRNLEIGDKIIKNSSKSLEKERMLSSLFDDGQDTVDMQALKPELAHILECGKAVDCKSGIQFTSLIPGIPAANGIPPQQCQSLGEGTSDNAPKCTRTHSTGKRCTFESNPLEETLGSQPDTVPYRFDVEKPGFDKGKAVVSPFVSRSIIVPKQSQSANARLLKHEQNHWHSSDLVCQRKVDRSSKSDYPLDACNRESVTSDHYLSTFGRGWFPGMRCSGIRLFPSQRISSEESETKKSHNSLLKVQNYVHDVETMRICTTLDALEGMPECPRFSQTTNGMFVREKTNVNVLKENNMFRSTAVITKVNGGISSEHHYLLPFSGQGKQQVKLQPLCNLIDSEANKNIGDAKASKVTRRNESSVETDTMDIHSFKEKNSTKNLHSGSNSTTSTKARNMESNIPPWIRFASSREVGHGRPINKVPDINLGLPPLHGVASSSENMQPSSSKTQSLDTEKLLEHVEQPKPNPIFSLDDFPNADPGNRLVKRLKLSCSTSSAVQSSNFSSNSSHEKMDEFFSRILKSSPTSSAPSLTEHHGKKSMQSDKNRDFSERDEEPKDKGKTLLLSHAWVQRWLHNGQKITEKEPETEVVCEPKSSKLTLEVLQREQLPSIAAMALMGKALTCFQPCELQKRGPFTIWNTKTLQ